MAFKKGNQIFINSNPKKPHFRTLTNTEIEEIASKEWKEQHHRTSVSPRKNQRLKNLTGPKTVEGKKRALQNLRPNTARPAEVPRTHGGYILRILNDEEREFFEERRKKYLEDFELNESSDDAILTSILLDEVIMRRLMLYKAENPTKSIDKAMTECTRRLRENLDALGVTRKQRQGSKVNVEHSISELAAQVYAELNDNPERRAELLAEEEALLARKRFKNQIVNVIDVEYQALDESQVHDDD